MQEGSRRAVVAAFLANLGIAAAKLVAFLVTGSASLAAEAVHSGADTANQILLLVGERRSRRRATAEHPFGYGMERYFWSFVVALVLFSLGSLFALFEAVGKLRRPHEVASLPVAIAVLVVAIAFESLSLRTAVRAGRQVKRVPRWLDFVRRTKSPEIPVVLLEDTGALAGLGFALAGVVAAQVTGNPRFDAAGSLAIGVLLGVIALTLAVEMKSLLIGEAAVPETEASIRRAAEEHGHVRRVIHLRTLHLGPEELLVAMKVEMDTELTFPEVSRVIDEIEARVRSAVPEARVMYVEPDCYRGDRA